MSEKSCSAQSIVLLLTITVVPECFKGDSISQWKSGKFDPAPPKAPEPIVTKICMGDYVGDPYPYAKFHNDPFTPFCPPNVRKFASSDSASFFGGFFRQRTAKTAAPIFTISTLNDVVSRKDVPFAGLENKNLYFDPIFPPKQKFLANS